MQSTKGTRFDEFGRKEVLTDIPTSDLSQVISDFESEGAKVKTVKQDEGHWIVEAVFLDKS